LLGHYLKKNNKNIERHKTSDGLFDVNLYAKYFLVISLLGVTNYLNDNVIKIILLAVTFTYFVKIIATPQIKLLRIDLKKMRLNYHASAEKLYKSTTLTIRIFLIIIASSGFFLPFLVNNGSAINVFISIFAGAAVLFMLLITATKERATNFYREISKTLDRIKKFFTRKIPSKSYVLFTRTEDDFEFFSLETLNRPPIQNIT
jgi:hypothetical protein